MKSSLEIWDMRRQSRRVLFESELHLEAPNWSPCGTYLLLNAEGALYRLTIETAELQPVDLDGIRRLNNDHGISPDGKIGRAHV